MGKLVMDPVIDFDLQFLLDMDQATLLKQAKQGNPQALQILLQNAFKSHQITVKVTTKARCINLLLEAAEPPAAAMWVPFLQQRFAKLGLEAIDTLKIYGRQTGHPSFAWQQMLTMASANNPFPDLNGINAIEADKVAATDHGESLKQAQPLPIQSKMTRSPQPPTQALPLWITPRIGAIAIALIALVILVPRMVRGVGSLFQVADTTIRDVTITPKAKQNLAPLLMGMVGRGQQAHFAQEGKFSTDLESLGLDIDVPEGYVFDVADANQSQVFYTLHAPKSDVRSYVGAIFVIQESQTINKIYVNSDGFYLIICHASGETAIPPEFPVFVDGQITCGKGSQELIGQAS